MKRRIHSAAWGLACLALLAFTTPTAAVPAAPPATEAELAALVERVMTTGLTPGMGVAVIQDGRLVLERGFGLAELETPRKVEPSTRFYTASTSKAFSALAAALLAARGELDLEAALLAALPRAHWHPELRPDSIRVRDLISLTHGIAYGPATYRIAFSGEAAEADLLAALVEHAPADWGRAFHYDNLGYDLLGLVFAAQTGRNWREVLEQEVITPLGLQRTSTRRSTLPDAEVALGYELGTVDFERCLAEKTDANMGPANGLFCSAGDLARLLLAELHQGRLEGRQVFPAATVAATQQAQVEREPSGELFVRTAWGMGWDIGTYAGETCLFRNGAFAGYYSHASFLPERGAAVVILVNGGMAGAQAAEFAAAMLYDRLLGRTGERAFLDELTAMKAQALKAIAADRAKRAQRPQVLPLPFAAYAGTYANPNWGTVTLLLSGERLEARLGNLRCPVEVYDSTKHVLRVDMAGRGTLLTALAPEGAQAPTAILFLDQTFTRR